jgi:hypothetical protein
MRSPARHTVALVAVAAAWAGGLAACGGPPAQDALTGPLTAFPSCQGQPTVPAAEPVAGMATPRGIVLLQSSAQGPVRNAVGYVERTPVQIRIEYERRDDLELLHSEDEVFESELLVSDGTHRTFVRATAICDRGSNVLMVVAPEGEEQGLPEPGHGQTGG